MAVNTLKCNSCNIVINEVLSYIQYKFDVIDTVSLKKLCESTYSDKEIENAKKLLFESTSTTETQQFKVRRKGTQLGGKNMRNLDDIICFFKEVDPDSIPVFVARDLQKLPPTSIDHIDSVTLLKDVIKMRNELDGLQEKYATISQLKELQMDIEDLKYTSTINQYNNVNTRKRGTYVYDSGPIGLPHSINEENVGKSKSIEYEIATDGGQRKSPHSSLSHVSSECGAGAKDLLATASAISVTHVQRQSVQKTTAKQNHESSNAKSPVTKKSDDISNEQCNANHSSALSFAATLQRQGTFKSAKQSDEWTLVQRKKLRNRFIGSTGKAITDPGMKFKAASVKIPLFITNVSKEVSEKDISDYILQKTKEIVSLQKMTLKTERHYNSFKMYVYKHNLHLYLDDNLWPVGINCRHFVRYKKTVNIRNDLKSLQK